MGLKSEKIEGNNNPQMENGSTTKDFWQWWRLDGL